MIQKSLRLFDPINPFDQEISKQLSKVSLRNIFFISNIQGMQSQILLGITENYLITCWKPNGQQQYFSCKLAFDLKFQVLRREWSDQKTPGIPYGIRFQKDKDHEVLDFYCNHPGIVNQWSLVLAKKINQRNFHQLFKAKKKIGKGAFATVYLAQRLTDKKFVAVKAFSKQKQFSGDKGKESLENEIKIMRGIEHQNIMKLQGIYQTQNSIYVTLEYLQGCQLNEELKKGKKFSLNQSIAILKYILQALRHLADRRIIHRDLKPENIMFKKPNLLDLSLCDFGLATFADQAKYLFVRCGTPGFVAPQIINIKDMSTKSEPISDVFSAGIIFHYVLFGNSIFPGTVYNQVLSQNRNCDFSFQKQQYQMLPPPVLDLLIRMLDKNQQTRISAEQALKHEVFESQMDIEEEEGLKEKQNMFENFGSSKIHEKAELVFKKTPIMNQNLPFVNKSENLKKKEPLNFTQIPKMNTPFQKML